MANRSSLAAVNEPRIPAADAAAKDVHRFLWCDHAVPILWLGLFEPADLVTERYPPERRAVRRETTVARSGLVGRVLDALLSAKTVVETAEEEFVPEKSAFFAPRAAVLERIRGRRDFFVEAFRSAGDLTPYVASFIKGLEWETRRHPLVLLDCAEIVQMEDGALDKMKSIVDGLSRRDAAAVTRWREMFGFGGEFTLPRPDEEDNADWRAECATLLQGRPTV